MKNERIPSAKEKDYQRRVNERMPKSKTLSQCIRAFVSGGIICCIGQLIRFCKAYAKLQRIQRRRIYGDSACVYRGNAYGRWHIR